MAQIFLTRRILLASSLALSLWLTGCGGTERTSTSTNLDNTQITEVDSNQVANNEGKKKVLTSFTVLADMA